jgi:hypothetical protein
MTKIPAGNPPAPKVSTKWKIGIFAISLTFVAIALGAIMSIVRDPLFALPAKAKIEAAKSLEELGPIKFEVDRENALFDRFGIFALIMALILPAAGLGLLNRAKSWRNFLLLMLGAGLACGVTLSSLHGSLHGLILPGGLQSPAYRAALRWSFLGLSVLDSLIVAAFFQKAAFRKPAGPQP